MLHRLSWRSIPIAFLLSVLLLLGITQQTEAKSLSHSQYLQSQAHSQTANHDDKCWWDKNGHKYCRDDNDKCWWDKNGHKHCDDNDDDDHDKCWWDKNGHKHCD